MPNAVAAGVAAGLAVVLCSVSCGGARRWLERRRLSELFPQLHSTRRGWLVALVVVASFQLPTAWTFELACWVVILASWSMAKERRGRAQRRHDLQNLVAALTNVCQALRSGCGLIEALDGMDVSSRTASDLSRVATWFRSGSSLAAAVERWRESSNERAVIAAANGLLVTLRLGGSRVKALEVACETARQWLHADRSADTQSAQARASVFTLTVLPVVVLTVSLTFSADARTVLMFTHAGGGIVLSGVLLDVAGLLSMTRMIRTAAP